MTTSYANQIELDRLKASAGAQFSQLLTDDGTDGGDASLANTGNITVYVEGPKLVTRLSFVMTDATALQQAGLGSQASPSNPLIVRKRNTVTGEQKIFIATLTSAGLLLFFESNSADLIGSAFNFAGILHFERMWGSPLVLLEDDRLEVNKNDDLSGLTRFNFYAAGHTI